MSSGYDDVGRFHHRFGLDNTTVQGSRPRRPEPEVLKFRMNFLLEELQELMEGLGAEFRLLGKAEEGDPGPLTIVYPTDSTPATPDHAKAFDSLIDLVYVAYGTAHLLGYPWAEGWHLVQRANMRKVRATEETKSERGGTWDVVKPPGWSPPDIEGLLRAKGWGETS